MKSQNLVYLIIGIALTVLFFIFRVDAYELLFYETSYNNSLYNLSLYNIFALLTVLFTWGGAAVYYYAINSVKFDRWWHWLIVLAAVTVLNPVVCYIVNLRAFADAGLDYGVESVAFEMGNLVWTALLFIVASFAMRWWSSNCRHTPIPQ